MFFARLRNSYEKRLIKETFQRELLKRPAHSLSHTPEVRPRFARGFQGLCLCLDLYARVNERQCEYVT